MGKEYAEITIRGENSKKRVTITSQIKPEILNETREKWQSLIDSAAKISNVPSGLIMRLNSENIEVYLKSRTNGNPYHEGEEAKLIYGLYCETVIGTQAQLHVPDARKSDIWKENNPDVDINMISYLGFPINWPDGEVFGTVCLLDNKENAYNENFRNLLFQVKQHIESDLKFLVAQQEISKTNQELKQMNRIKTRFLSLLSHDIRGNIGVLQEFLKLILTNYDQYTRESLYPMLKSLSLTTGGTLQTLENLLSWSKKDLLELKAEKEDVDLVTQLNSLIENFRQAIHLKGIHLKESFEIRRAIIRADENMVLAGLRNILSNAVKFTPGRGEISVSLFTEDAHYVVEIADTGRGMDEETQKNLFTQNLQKGSSGTDGESGAGIGLFITKEFLDMNGAVLKVKSEKNKGSVFRIEFPKT